MKLYYGGAEVPGWRRLLAAERVPSVSLSFVGLARRRKKLDAFVLADEFPADPGFRQDVFLDSGAYSLNKDDTKYTDAEAIALAAAYFTYVARNIERIDVYSEFDNVLNDKGARFDAREALAELNESKFMPIWHAEYGLDELEYLAEHYERVGVLQPDEETRDLTSLLRKLSGQTKLHGVAMTRMRQMRTIPWDSVGSTSWLAPGQWGETHVWTGQELKKYPVKYKVNSRTRHRTLIADAGFDPVAIARDATDEGTTEDRKELLRFSLWSWTQFVEDINRRREAGEELDDGPGEDVAVRGVPRTALVPIARDKVLLPVLSIDEVPGAQDEDPELQVGTAGSNLLRCNTCWVRDKCPMFQPDHECAYEIPVVIRTTTQARALRKALLGMQGQRVFRMSMFEQLEGGMVMGDLTREIAVLNKMLDADAEMERERATLEIKVTSDGSAGMLSRIFGTGVEERANALPEPLDASRMLERAEIWEGDVVDGEE